MTAKRLQVESLKEGGFSYPIVFEQDFSGLPREIRQLEGKGHKICIVTDSNVAPLYLEEVKGLLEREGWKVVSHILPAGESHKTLEEIQGIYEQLILERFDRKDLLAALGGGVVGDMTGFAAATYLRGVDFIQIPTTLLAQVDSSIGGKTGVDFKQYKNMVGAFHQPRLVYLNTAVLKSLPEVQFSCGMGEILKHGLIRDREYSLWLSENREEILKREETICREMIYKSCVIKKTVVEKDPTEKGERAVLNFGHTIGHAVEKLKDFQLLHGQCVAIGMAAAAYLSKKRGYLTQEDCRRIEEQLQSFQLPVRTEGLTCQEVLEATKSDKKMAGGRIQFVLLRSLGDAVIEKSLTDQELLDAIALILGEKGESL